MHFVTVIGVPVSYFKVIWYGSDPAVVQSKVIGFSILVVIRIHCIGFGVGAKSHLSVSRACTFSECPLWPMEPRKLSFCAWEDEIPTIWYRLCRRMLRSHRIYCTISP